MRRPLSQWHLILSDHVNSERRLSYRQLFSGTTPFLHRLLSAAMGKLPHVDGRVEFIDDLDAQNLLEHIFEGHQACQAAVFVDDQHEMLTAELGSASNRITQEVFQYWSQNQSPRVQFQLQRALPGDPAAFNEGWIIRTRIQNTRHGVSINFDERSTGFVWFFSFVIWFDQIRNNLGDNLFLLPDEPGLSLHANGPDRPPALHGRRACDQLPSDTTHSPFMIDASKLPGFGRWRTFSPKLVKERCRALVPTKVPPWATGSLTPIQRPFKCSKRH